VNQILKPQLLYPDTMTKIENTVFKGISAIKIITVKEILSGERLEIPSYKVVKSAELKKDNTPQIKLEL